jgi:hypothetical protein
MANGGIVDVSTGAAQAIGRYFSVVSVVPSFLYVSYVYLLIASGSWQHAPDWRQAFASLGHLGIGGIALLTLASIGLGVIIHPIQFATVQFFEGYWGTGPLAQAIRSQRILHYQRLCMRLDAEWTSANNWLADLDDAGIGGKVANSVRARSWADETLRVRGAFPSELAEVMPTRLGNVLRRAESEAGSQYCLDALQVVPHLMLTAPAGHADYVNDQRSQLDLAVRMTFLSAIATATAVLFLWPYHFWVMVALIPYAIAYLSYRGAVVAASHYGAAIDALINLDRFSLYQQLHLRLPTTTEEERRFNTKLTELLRYDEDQSLSYEHPGTADSPAGDEGDAGQNAGS